MASEALNKYIERRYDRWLDYARYHCALAGMDGEDMDVLNEVVAMLLEKKTEVILLEMMERTNEKYGTELDFYVLKIIKLNVTSDTAPYRHKYKPIPVDENVDWRRLNIEDKDDPEEDRNGYVCARFQEVRDILTELKLSERATRIFTWKFFAGESFADWPGPENRKELYAIYKKIFKIILDKKGGKLLL